MIKRKNDETKSVYSERHKSFPNKSTTNLGNINIVDYKRKKGISEMLSYVLLVSLGIFMAIALYASLKLIANVEPVASCEEGTYLTIMSYECFNQQFTITLKNNGRFSVNGFFISGSDKAERAPVTPIKALKKEDEGLEQGSYMFKTPFAPGASLVTAYEVSSIPFSEIKRIRIQPFIISENQVVVCQDAVINQDINCGLK